MRITAAYLLSFALLPLSAFAGPQTTKQICVYKGDNGRIEQVISRESVPEKFRKNAQCFNEKDSGSQRMAAPAEVRLEGSLRTEDMNTSIGRIHLRWERKSEQLFGRTPVRAMSDAANTVSRAINNAAFPSKLQKLSQEWQVVFLGDNVPAGQIPTQLITNCHPGWMTPPANIYIVSDRVAGGCGSRHSSASVADSTLTEVLLHEMGHAVEYQLLGKRDLGMDRMRAEGFATFFAIYSARYSSVANSRSMLKQMVELARYAINKSPNGFRFSGSAEDYARASMFFLTIEERLGLRTVVQIYDLIEKKSLDFFAAIKEAAGWDEKRRDKEIRAFLKL